MKSERLYSWQRINDKEIGLQEYLKVIKKSYVTRT